MAGIRSLGKEKVLIGAHPTFWALAEGGEMTSVVRVVLESVRRDLRPPALGFMIKG